MRLTEVPTGVFDIFGGGQYLVSDDTTPSSGLAMPFDLDAMSMPMDSLGAITDTPTDFDWVCDMTIVDPRTNEANYFAGCFRQPPSPTTSKWPSLARSLFPGLPFWGRIKSQHLSWQLGLLRRGTQISTQLLKMRLLKLFRLSLAILQEHLSSTTSTLCLTLKPIGNNFR
jgi:hypothetical protein